MFTHHYLKTYVSIRHIRVSPRLDLSQAYTPYLSRDSIDYFTEMEGTQMDIHYLYSNYYTCRNKYEHKVLFDKLFKLQPSIDIGH